VLQTVLPALLTAPGASSLTLEGGTHNPLAPPYEFFDRVFLPLLGRTGVSVTSRLESHGFYPAGGGRVGVVVEPVERLGRFDLLERGAVRRRRARALVANLPRHIAERELEVVRKQLSWQKESLEIVSVEGSPGPGNVLLLEVESEHVTEVICGFGMRGVRAEEVARRTVRQARRYLEAEVPVGEYLADQLLLPLALAGGGSFVTLPLSNHASTNIEVVKMFLDVTIQVHALSPSAVRVEVGRA
jgi:RNA 3'-terminal phosphate cyclase (ATP)